MFDIKNFFDILTDEYIKNSKKEKYLRKVLMSEDFLGYIFNPPQDMTTERTKVDLYEVMGQPGILKLIINTIMDYGYESFNRTTAVFLYSVCQSVVDKCNSDDAEVREAYRGGDISRSSKEAAYERIERKFSYAMKINDACNKIVKDDMKRLLRQTDLPKETITNSLKCVPEARFLKRDKVGYYLNIVTSEIYSTIDEDESYYVKHVDWAPFFRYLFGRDNEVQVAMFLTLEGTSRIKKDWRNAKTITAIWDSLTAYALEVLESSGAEERAHMLDLYSKIVSSMNESNRNELRVDLRALDDTVFPNLTRSIASIKDKLGAAIKQIKNNDAATKEVTKLS